MKRLFLSFLLWSSPALAAHGHHAHKKPAKTLTHSTAHHLHVASYQGGRIKDIMEGTQKSAPVMQKIYGVLAHVAADAQNDDRQRTMTVSAAMRSPDFNCLKNAIIYEARGEPDTGQVGVASVASNRVSNSRSTYCRVIYSKTKHNSYCQFEFACVKHIMAISDEAVRKAKTIALGVLTGAIHDVTRGSTFFRTCERGKSSDGFSFVMKIGGHCYYNDAEKDVPKHRPRLERYHLVEDAHGTFGYRIVNDRTNQIAML